MGIEKGLKEDMVMATLNSVRSSMGGSKKPSERGRAEGTKGHGIKTSVDIKVGKMGGPVVSLRMWETGMCHRLPV